MKHRGNRMQLLHLIAQQKWLCGGDAAVWRKRMPSMIPLVRSTVNIPLNCTGFLAHSSRKSWRAVADRSSCSFHCYEGLRVYWLESISACDGLVHAWEYRLMSHIWHENFLLWNPLWSAEICELTTVWGCHGCRCGCNKLEKQPYSMWMLNWHQKRKI